MNRLKLAGAISVLFSLASPVSAQSTNLAMAQPGVEQSLPAIESFITDKAQANRALHDPKFVCKLAHLYQTGQGVSKNPTAAFKLYEYAAKKGVAEAQYALALMYSDDTGPFNVADSQQKALFWLEKAVNQGYKQAEFTYRYMLDNTYYSGC